MLFFFSATNYRWSSENVTKIVHAKFYIVLDDEYKIYLGRMWVVTQRASCQVPLNIYKSRFLAFLVFVVTIVSFITKILSSNNVAKRDAILL